MGVSEAVAALAFCPKAAASIPATEALLVVVAVAVAELDKVTPAAFTNVLDIESVLSMPEIEEVDMEEDDEDEVRWGAAPAGTSTMTAGVHGCAL